jgi:hypothetical protein
LPDKEKLDSYDRFFKAFNIKKEDFYEFGIKEAIYPPLVKVEEQWEELKQRILNNGAVSIRRYGRDKKGTELYIGLYRELFKNNRIYEDRTNNQKPQQIIERLTGFKRKQDILNYQVSHIFGMTKNIFMFEASWNIVFIPKIMDPFTGHETKGDWPKEFQEIFLKSVYSKYKKFIDEFNSIISQGWIVEGIRNYIDGLKINSTDENLIMIRQFEKDVHKEFDRIQLTPL